MRKFILIIVLLFASNLFSQGINTNHDLSLEISYLPLGKNLKINIFSPGNKNVWEYNTVVYYRSINITAKEWYSGKGNYKMTIYLIDKDSSNINYDSMEFSITGKEYNVNTQIWFGEPSTKNEILIKRFTMFRYYASSDSIKIKEHWDSKTEGYPEYIIYNKTKRTIYGTSLFGNFFGWVKKLKQDEWVAFNRGGMCGTVSGGKPVLPGDSTISDEGCIIRKKSFTNGKYKYLVQYSFEKDLRWDFFFSNQETQFKNVHDLYLLEKEFIISDN
jgi:hypothetical protein